MAVCWSWNNKRVPSKVLKAGKRTKVEICLDIRLRTQQEWLRTKAVSRLKCVGVIDRASNNKFGPKTRGFRWTR